MSVIGEKLTEFAGTMTSVAMTETETVVNNAVDAGPFGTVLYTLTFGERVDAAGETGPHTIRGQCFSPDGTTLTFVGGGTWRNRGNHRELKHVTVLSDGQRTFAVENLDFNAQTASGTIYGLE